MRGQHRSNIYILTLKYSKLIKWRQGCVILIRNYVTRYDNELPVWSSVGVRGTLEVSIW
jgi:hypothetical protein